MPRQLGTGAPRENQNANIYGRNSARSREVRALGRVLNRVADLATAQMAVMNSRADGDVHRVEIAEQEVSRCIGRLRQAALALDRVLVERGDKGRHGLVEGRCGSPGTPDEPADEHARRGAINAA